MVRPDQYLFAGSFDLERKTRRFTPTAWINAAPGRAFVAFLMGHTVIWTVLPTLLYLNLPLDLVEALMYGQEWQLGYDKLPPLPWWLVEAAYQSAGHDFAYYLLAQISVGVAFAFVFIAARPLVGTLGALVSVLIIDGLHYFNHTAPKFNHDVVQLPFWAMAGFSFHRALRKNETLDWVLLGIAVGMSLWAKYFVVVLAAPMMLFVMFDREARKKLALPGPYIAAAVALIVMAPHLIWLVKNDFLPFAYAEHRAVLPRGWYDHLRHPIEFAISQIFFLLPALLIAAPLFLNKDTAKPAHAPHTDAYDERIVTLLAFGPMAVMLAMSAITGRGAVAMWGYPLWLFLGLWLVMTAHQMITLQRLSRIWIIWAVVFSCLAAAFIVVYDIMPRFDAHYRAVFFPGGDLGREIARRFRAATGKAPKYVIGTMWDGGNVSHYAPSHPRVLVDGEPKRAPWIDIADVRREGAVVVWTNSDPKKMPVGFRKIAADAAIQPSFVLHHRLGSIRTTVGWAILFPLPSYAQIIRPER
jgi:hypothetical protein